GIVLIHIALWLDEWFAALCHRLILIESKLVPRSQVGEYIFDGPCTDGAWGGQLRFAQGGQPRLKAGITGADMGEECNPCHGLLSGVPDLAKAAYAANVVAGELEPVAPAP